MKNYEKPMVMVNEGLAEGVYAASGADCWSIIKAESVQEWDGVEHIFEIICGHEKLDTCPAVETRVITINFNHAITSASTNADGCTFSGSCVTVTHAFSISNDIERKEFKVEVAAADEATTRALAITGISISK